MYWKQETGEGGRDCLVGLCEGFGFHSKYNRKPLECSE